MTDVVRSTVTGSGLSFPPWIGRRERKTVAPTDCDPTERTDRRTNGWFEERELPIAPSAAFSSFGFRLSFRLLPFRSPVPSFVPAAYPVSRFGDPSPIGPASRAS